VSVVSAEGDATPEPVIMDGFTKELEAEVDNSKESFVFQAEVGRLMDIIINCK
jgi:hypothetical protein